VSLEIVLQWVGPIGILAVVGAVALAGWWRAETIPNWSFAAQRFSTDFPEHEPVFGTVSTDGRVALLELEKDKAKSIGFVVVTGDKWTTRLLQPDISHIARCETGLKLTMDDFTMPNVKIKLERDIADRWYTAFNQPKVTSNGSAA
jgi:hypothetical protein|tara:strand:+ start:11930 stop:12367 length:438 start_codon:yes stop_codon:yes gene_type:complete